MYYRHPRLLGLLILTYGWDRITAMQTINARHRRRDDGARQYIRAALSLRHSRPAGHHMLRFTTANDESGLAFARIVAH